MTESPPAPAGGARSRRLAAIRAHSGSRFVVVGGLSVAIDVGSLALLHGGLGVALIPATMIAFAASAVANFSLNRSWTFAAAGPAGRTRGQLVRFAILFAANYGATVGIVAGLTAAGLFYLASKLVANVVVAAVNYLAYRHWVFR